MSASNHVAGSDSGGGNGHDCSRRCSGVRANGRGSESLAADGFVLAEEVGVVCSHVFIGAVVGEEAGGVRGLQSRVHWNYTWRASGGVYSRGCMRGRRIKKHQVSFGERRRARARRSSIAWVRGRRFCIFRVFAFRGPRQVLGGRVT